MSELRHELDELHKKSENVRRDYAATLKWLIAVLVPIFLVISGLFFTAIRQIDIVQERQNNVILHNREQDQKHIEFEQRIRELEMWRYRVTPNQSGGLGG